MGDNPVSELVKAPVPVPSLVLESFTVGFVVVLQQTPLVVIVALPSLVILPPQTAVLAVIDDTAVVLMVDKAGSVVKLISFP